MTGKGSVGFVFGFGLAALSVAWGGTAVADEPAQRADADASGGAEAEGDALIGDLATIGYAEAVRHAALGFEPSTTPALDAAAGPAAHIPLDILAVTGDRVRFRLTNPIATWAVWIDTAALAPLVVSPQVVPLGDDGAEVRVHGGARVTLDPAAGTARVTLDGEGLEWLIEVDLPRSTTGPVAESAPDEARASGSLDIEIGSVLYARPSRFGRQLLRVGDGPVSVEPAPALEPVDGFRAVVLESHGSALTAWVREERVERSIRGCGAKGGTGYARGGTLPSVWLYPAVGARIYGSEAGALPIGEVHTSAELLQVTAGPARTSVSLWVGGWTVEGWIANDDLFTELVQE